MASIDPLRVVANDRSGATNRVVLRIWNIFLSPSRAAPAVLGSRPNPGLPLCCRNGGIEYGRREKMRAPLATMAPL
jgi:hypothetical protein